jgi:hypothetical protein
VRVHEVTVNTAIQTLHSALHAKQHDVAGFYTAPEVAAHHRHPGSDVYSFGVGMLWEFMAGWYYQISRGGGTLPPHYTTPLSQFESPFRSRICAAPPVSEPRDQPSFEQ